MSYFFTSESVSEGHPDKVADQISDALLDNFLAQDPAAKVACETLVTTGLVVLSGEINTVAYVDVQEVARNVVRRIGYNKGEYMFESNSCGVISTIHGQSPDINQGVIREKDENQGAGDQGIIFGYATNETESYMPLTLLLSHELLLTLATIRREEKVMKYLRPDSKSQVTIEYDSVTHKPKRISTIVISTQHDQFDNDDNKMLEQIKEDIRKYVIPATLKRLGKSVENLVTNELILHVNPTGKFVIGGPHGDTGLTGRKIIVDTYGGHGAHGGGAFSGKDSSKVDRSAAYAARYLAKNLVAAGVSDKILVQLAYAIGMAEPVGLYVNTYGTAKSGMSDSEIALLLPSLLDLRPYSIIQKFGLTNPIFEPTASYGHFGRKPFKKEVSLFQNGKTIKKEVEFFGWENLDLIETIKLKLKLS